MKNRVTFTFPKSERFRGPRRVFNIIFGKNLHILTELDSCLILSSPYTNGLFPKRVQTQDTLTNIYQVMIFNTENTYLISALDM